MLWHYLKGCSRDAAYDGAAHTFDQQLKRHLLALHAVQRSSSRGAGNPIAELSWMQPCRRRSKSALEDSWDILNTIWYTITRLME